MTNSRIQQLLQFHQNAPKDSFILFALAKEYEKLGELQDALEYYQKITTAEPDYVGVYYHLGKLLEMLGKPAQAFTTYKKGMEIAHQIGDQHALGELAAAKLNLGEEEDFE